MQTGNVLRFGLVPEKSFRCLEERKSNLIEFVRFAFCCDWRNSTDWGEAFIQSLGDVWSLVKLEHCLREVKVHEFHLSCASPGSVG